MAAFPTSIEEQVLQSPEDSFQNAEVNEEFTFKVLDEYSGHAASGRTIKLVGRRLIAQVSDYIKPDTCIRIDCDDALLLGEALGCWREGRRIFVAVDLLQSLKGLEELAILREERWGSNRPLKPQIRQRA